MSGHEREFTAPDHRGWMATRLGAVAMVTAGQDQTSEHISTGLWFQCLASEESRFHPVAASTDLPTSHEFDVVSDEQLVRWWKAAVQVGTG